MTGGVAHELRRGDAVVSTGHLTRDRPLAVGDRIVIGGVPGIVRLIEPVLGESELHLVVQRCRKPVLKHCAHAGRLFVWLVLLTSELACR